MPQRKRTRPALHDMPAPVCPIRGEIEARLDGIKAALDASNKGADEFRARMEASLDKLNSAVLGDDDNIGIRGRLLLVQTTVRTWKRIVWVLVAATATYITEQAIALFRKS